MAISFEFKEDTYFNVTINENGVFISNQQAIISGQKSKEILAEFMGIVQK